MNFNAIFLEKNDNDFSAKIKSIQKDTLLGREGNTLIKVLYSSLNYKDALAITNKGPVVRQWPMIPGIDGVGEVISSDDNKFNTGDIVVLNGWGCGEKYWGCLSEYAYLNSDWLIPLNKNITPKQSMAVGTAGYTAALSILKLIENNIKPNSGEIVVSGATGGVGSIAIMILSKMGYSVTAITSKKQDHEYLIDIGVQNVVSIDEYKDKGKPLQKELWAAGLDTLGGNTLSNICSQIKYNGVVTTCGMAQSLDFPTTVAPFILRGITLFGIDSVMNSIENRKKAWDLISKYLDVEKLNLIFKEISLADCIDVSELMIKGQIKGRFVVNVNQK